MKRPYFWGKSSVQNIVIQSIKKGAVVLADCDTVMGLFAAVSQEGVQALDTIKIRRDKPYLIIIGTKTDWKDYVSLEWMQNNKEHVQAVSKLIDAIWPGAVTLIFPMRSDMPSYIGSAENTVALRMPNHDDLCAVAHACGGIFSTSANKAGHSVPATIDHVDNSIKQAVDCIILNTDQNQNPLPSTILDCTHDAIKVVREGAYPIKDLEQLYGKSFFK